MRHGKTGPLKSALLGATALAALSLAGTGAAQAEPVSWVFYNTSGNSSIITGGGGTTIIDGTTGTTAVSFSSTPALDPTQTVTLTPFGPTNNKSGSTLHLYQKNGHFPSFGSTNPTAEQGIGLTNDPARGNQDEIASLNQFPTGSAQSYVQIDISNLSDPPLNTLTLGFTMGSVTGADGWAVYGTTTTAFSTDHLLASGNGGTGTLSSVIGTYDYLDVIATGGNVLLKSLSASANNPTDTPEPGSLALLGTGLLGLGLVARRRRRTA